MNEREIRKIFEEERQLVLQILKQRSIYQTWIHPYTALEFIDAKTKYGKACPTGIIKISRVFVNTREYGELRDTIRHELAHLIVGNKHKHDSVWQTVAHVIGARPQPRHKATGQLVQNMKRKWLLMGEMADGTVLEFHASHNKMSKYLKYNPAVQHMECRGVKINKFYYVRNK